MNRVISLRKITMELKLATYSSKLLNSVVASILTSKAWFRSPKMMTRGFQLPASLTCRSRWHVSNMIRRGLGFSPLLLLLLPTLPLLLIWLLVTSSYTFSRWGRRRGRIFSGRRKQRVKIDWMLFTRGAYVRSIRSIQNSRSGKKPN